MTSINHLNLHSHREARKHALSLAISKFQKILYLACLHVTKDGVLTTQVKYIVKAMRSVHIMNSTQQPLRNDGPVDVEVVLSRPRPTPVLFHGPRHQRIPPPNNRAHNIVRYWTFWVNAHILFWAAAAPWNVQNFSCSRNGRGLESNRITSNNCLYHMVPSLLFPRDIQKMNGSFAMATSGSTANQSTVPKANED